MNGGIAVDNLGDKDCGCSMMGIILLTLVIWTVVMIIVKVYQGEVNNNWDLEEIREHYSLPQFIVIAIALGPIYWGVWRTLVLIQKLWMKLWLFLGEIGNE